MLASLWTSWVRPIQARCYCSRLTPPCCSHLSPPPTSRDRDRSWSRSRRDSNSAEKAKEKASGEVRFPRLRLSSLSPTRKTGRHDQNCNHYRYRRLPYNHHNHYYVTTSVRIRATCTSPIHAGPELSTNTEGFAGVAYTTLITQPSQTESYCSCSFYDP